MSEIETQEIRVGVGIDAYIEDGKILVSITSLQFIPEADRETLIKEMTMAIAEALSKKSVLVL